MNSQPAMVTSVSPAQSPALPLRNNGKWFSSPVGIYAGSVEETRKRVPSFERRPFASSTAANSHMDMIVRLALEAPEVPVGVVSKSYVLIQHEAVFDSIVAVLDAAGIPPAELKVSLTLTEYGERMELRVLFPDFFQFDPGDGNPTGLQLRCSNSVDGSSRLFLLLGWLRFVCGNGLILGTTRLNVRMIHNRQISIPRLADSLLHALGAVNREKNIIRGWAERPVTEDALIGFVDGPLRKRWGTWAAARAYLICTKGIDGEPRDPFGQAPPHLREMLPGKTVPGALVPARTVYAVSQALSWLAKERSDVSEEYERTRDIPTLIRVLLDHRN